MSFFQTILKTTLSQRMRQLRCWLLIILIPAMLFGAQQVLPPREMTAPVQVGVVLPQEGGEALWQLLEDRSDAVLSFISTDEDTLFRDIAAGRLDCGLVAAGDFSRRIRALDTEGIFTLYIGSGSSVYPLVQETVAACVAQLISGPMAQQYLEDAGISTEYAGPLVPANPIAIHMQTLDGEPMEALSVATGQRDGFLCWLLCAGLLVWCLLTGCALGQQSSRNSVGRMVRMQGHTLTLGGMFLGEAVPILLCGFAGAAVLGLGISAWITVPAYVLYMGAWVLLLSRRRWLWESIPVLTPFVLIISLLLSGVLTDIPALRFSPAALFVSGCGGSRISAGILAAAALALWGLNLLADRIAGRRM